jgi:hypothetical protein
MVEARLLDSAGRRRSPASMPGYHLGRIPRNKGQRYPADPPRTDRDRRCHAPCRRRPPWRSRPGSNRDPLARRAAHPASTVADRARPRPAPRIGPRAARRRRTATRDRHGRPGLREHPTVARGSPVNARRSAVLCPRRPHPRPRLVGRRRPGSLAPARAPRAGVRRRFAPHQLRHAHAIELAREGVPLHIIQRQLGHQNPGVTSIYLQGIDPGEIIETIHARRPPMIPASAGLDLRR